MHGSWLFIHTFIIKGFPWGTSKLILFHMSVRLYLEIFDETEYPSTMNLLLVALLTEFVLFCIVNGNKHQYCIVGAGPSGEFWERICTFYTSTSYR